MVGATLFTLTDPLPSSPNEILAQLEDGDALFDMKEIEHPTLDKLKDKSHLGLSRKVPIRNNNSYAKKIDALRQETINNETLMNSRSFLLLEAESNPNLRGMTDDEKIRILTEACADHIESIKTEIAETELLMQENKRKKKEKREKRRMNKKTVTQPDYAEMFEKMKQEMKQDMKQDMERNNNELKQEVSDLKKRTTNLENAVGYQYAGGLLHDRVSGTRDAVLRFIQECSDHNSLTSFFASHEEADVRVADQIVAIIPIARMLDALQHESGKHRNPIAHPRNDRSVVPHLTTILCEEPTVEGFDRYQDTCRMVADCSLNLSRARYKHRKDFRKLIVWLRSILNDDEFDNTDSTSSQYVSDAVYSYLMNQYRLRFVQQD